MMSGLGKRSAIGALCLVVSALTQACGSEATEASSDLPLKTAHRGANKPGANSSLTATATGFTVGSVPGGEENAERWLVRAEDAPVTVRSDFFGVHVETSTGWPSYETVPPPTYPFGLVRSLDHNGPGLEVDLQWARLETAPGVYDFAPVERWIAETPSKTRIFTVSGTPAFHQKYPGEAWRYPYLPGGGSPPADPSAVAAFVDALLTRFANQIHYVEIWNEPNFYFGSDTDATRWDSAATQQYGTPPFFSGTASDLARMARAVVGILGGRAKLMAGAWEGQSEASPANSMARFSAASDGEGGAGKDSVQAFSFHHYMYTNNPNDIVATIDGYRARLSEQGYPSDVEFHCSEIGHEAPTPASTLSDGDVARNIVRATAIAAAMRVATIAWYKHSSEVQLKAPFKNPVVSDAMGRASTLAGKTIRQAALLKDKRVWVRFDTNSELVE